MIVYTDGSAKPNPGKGGYAAIFEDRVVSGSLSHTTNNYAELYAICAAVAYAPEGSSLLVYTDSALCEGWLVKSYKHNHQQSQVLCDLIGDLARARNITIEGVNHVPGHSGHELNEMADREAVRRADMATPLPDLPTGLI